MNFDCLLVDGYNLLHLDGVIGDLQTARQRLVRQVEQMIPEMAAHATVVFDGREKGTDLSLSAPHIEVVFSPSNRTADAVIERMVSESDHPEKILVVTSDRVEEQIVSAAGAFVLSCRGFVNRCSGTNSRCAVYRRSVRGTESTLGDFFPKSAE